MRSILLIASVTVLAACGSVSGAATGGHGSRSFALADFDAVKLAGSDDVRVVQGSAFSVVATGPNDALDRLDIHKEGATLVITRKTKGSWGWSADREGASVTVIMPAIRAAMVAGSGDMSVERGGGSEFRGGVTGSGNLDLRAIQAATVKLEVTGSGDLSARGAAKTVAISLTGSGDIDAGALTAETASVAVQGSGDVSSRASRSAVVNIAGSGDVMISGTRNCTVNKAGSGEAHCTG